MLSTGGMPVVATGNSDGSGFGGGGWLAIIVIIALLGGRGFGGFGGGGYGGDSVANGIRADIDTGFIREGQVDIMQELCTGFGNVNTNIATSNYTNLLGQKDLSAEIAACCCNTQRSIDSVKFEMAQDTCAILQGQRDQTQQILGYLINKDLTDKNEKISALKSQIDKQDIINAMYPQRPIPAYQVPNPAFPYGVNGYTGYPV